MKVIHISTYDRKGGAAIAAYRLHTAFLKNGIDSIMLVKEKTMKEDSTVITAVSPRLKRKWLSSIVDLVLGNQKPKAEYGFFSFFEGDYDLSVYRELQEADIIYIHWINNGYIDMREIRNILGMGKPVYWLLHDMFPITGGCHYAMECEGFKENCQLCKFFEGRVGKDSSIAYNQLRDRAQLKKYDNLRFVATTNWMTELEQESSISKEIPVSLIPYCLDIEKFQPIDKRAARKLFHVPDDKKVILFGAQGALYNYYKGFGYFQEALELLEKKEIEKDDVVIMIFGSSYNCEIDKAMNFQTNFLGNLLDEYSLIMAYNCADVFVIPSLAEAFGQVIIESMACGTPVVGFNIGGIPDNVNEETGYLANYCDSGDLAEGIYRVLYQNTPDKMVEFVRERYAENIIVQKHREMWEK